MREINYVLRMWKKWFVQQLKIKHLVQTTVIHRVSANNTEIRCDDHPLIMTYRVLEMYHYFKAKMSHPLQHKQIFFITDEFLRKLHFPQNFSLGVGTNFIIRWKLVSCRLQINIQIQSKPSAAKEVLCCFWIPHTTVTRVRICVMWFAEFVLDSYMHYSVICSHSASV